MRILNWFRRKTPSPTSAASALAMVLLPGTGAVDARVAFEYLQREWSDLPSIADLDGEGEVALARIPGGQLGLVNVPMPVPAGDLVGPTAVAWHWRTAAAAIAQHQTHVIVFANSTSLDAVELRLLHTKLVASVAATANAIGVYVGDAMLVQATEEYVDQARAAARDALPITLWIGFNPVKAEGTLSAYTTGLTGFGLLELEVHGSTQRAAEVLGRMADAASYQIATGQNLGDGDTFGASASERITVRHAQSNFIPDATVAVLGL